MACKECGMAHGFGHEIKCSMSEECGLSHIDALWIAQSGEGAIVGELRRMDRELRLERNHVKQLQGEVDSLWQRLEDSIQERNRIIDSHQSKEISDESKNHDACT